MKEAAAYLGRKSFKLKDVLRLAQDFALTGESLENEKWICDQCKSELPVTQMFVIPADSDISTGYEYWAPEDIVGFTKCRQCLPGYSILTKA